MKKILKAMTSMLVAAMVFCVGGGAVPVKAAEKEVKVYVKNTPNWDEVSVYSYNPEAFGDWPGTLMTKEADDWYSITAKVDSDTISFVINQNVNDGEQTVDVEDVSLETGKVWIVIGEKGENGKYEATAKTVAEAGWPGADATEETADETPANEEDKDETPTTGDTTPILPIAAVGTVALLALGATSLKKKSVQ
jgi:hypothetical protein